MLIEPIRPTDMSSYMEQPGCVVVDLRKRVRFDEEHIPNAISIPFDHMNSQIESLKKYDTVILYCERGNISLMAARNLVRAGVNHVYSLYGGYDEYKRESKRYL